MVRVTYVLDDSIAKRAGICAGDLLVAINGHEINDVLDYRFYLAEERVVLSLMRGGKTFVKKIILDNILPGDIYIKSREMQFQNETKRVVYLIHMEQKQDVVVVEMLQKLFPDRQHDFAITILK